MISSARKSLQALDNNDIGFLAREFSPAEQWRVLGHYFNDLSYFDIETSGLSRYTSVITAIACFHQSRFHTFVRNENLDDFLPLLEEVTLLTSFNGNSFDIPYVLDQFHIPELPCPHIDLRWVFYHAGLKGGLKAIEKNCGLARPDDLADISGEDAVRLWAQWHLEKNEEARRRLIRYCKADVVALIMLAQQVLARQGQQVSLPVKGDLFTALL